MGRAIAEPAQLLVGDAVVASALELARVLFAGEEAERDALPVAVHARVEELQEVLRLRQFAQVLAALLLEARKDPLLESLHVHVEPVPAPVDPFRVPGQLLAVLRRKLLPQRPRVRALEDEPLACHEGQEELPGHLHRRQLLVGRLERLIGAGEKRRGDGGAPGGALVGDELAARPGELAEHGRRSPEVRLSAHRVRLEPGVDGVAQRAGPLRPLALALPLAQGGKLHRPPHVERVHVAGSELVDALGPSDARGTGDAQDPGGHQVDRNQIEDELVPRGIRAVPLQGHEDERSAGREALVPAGERETDRALHDGGADDGVLAPARGDGLLAHRLGVRVRVGPAPRLRPCHAGLDELLREPQLALAARGEPQRFLVVRTAPFRLEPAHRRGAELGGERVIVRLFSQSRDQLLDVAKLLLEGELRSAQPLFVSVGVLLGKAAQDGLVLEYGSSPGPSDEAGGDVHERRVGAPAKLGGIARAVGVHGDGELERRIEGDEPGAVDDAAEPPAQRLDLPLGNAEQRLADVARDRPALLPEEFLDPLAMTLAQRAEGLRVDHAAEEPILGRSPGARSHEHVDAPDPGIAIEQHGERDLAEKPGDAGDEDFAPAEHLGEIDLGSDGQVVHGSPWAAYPGFRAAPPRACGSPLPSNRASSSADTATSVITMGG